MTYSLANRKGNTYGNTCKTLKGLILLQEKKSSEKCPIFKDVRHKWIDIYTYFIPTGFKKRTTPLFLGMVHCCCSSGTYSIKSPG
jgi:hypothetical protein